MLSGIWSYSEHSIIIRERPENHFDRSQIADVWLRSVPHVQRNVL